MSDHVNSCLMNDVMIRLEEQSFFANIGEKRTLSFVRRALALSRYHDGNPGEALAGVGQRLGICYYCWDRGHDLRQGICRDCRVADEIGIEPGEADDRLPGEAAFSDPFISKETVRELMELLPERLKADLDMGTLRKLPGNCIDMDEDIREIRVDEPWGVDHLPGRRKRSGTLVLMIEMLSHPYPRVAQRLCRYVSMLSKDLCRAGDTVEKPPLIIPMLLYDGLPEWTPRSFGPEWTSFGFKFVDVRRSGWPGSNARLSASWLPVRSGIGEKEVTDPWRPWTAAATAFDGGRRGSVSGPDTLKP